ncbi:MAG TPA: FtsX-like permease family protein [Rhizomicrobium sp.]|nr:FtsX-like permease family protein [Rhizomicrobium sp.]
MRELRRAWTFARRELRGGMRGFRIFFLCLLLGTAAIAGVESLSDAFLTGLRDQGQTFLGGDVAVELVHRPATPPEHAFLARYGRISADVSMRAMAYALRGGQQAERQLIELKAVDESWPMFGAPSFTPDQKTSSVLYCEEDGVCGAAVEQTLLDRLHIGRGDLIRIGDATLRVMAVINSEPDRISTGFSLGPHVLISAKAVAGTHLVRPDSLINYRYRLAFTPNASSGGATIDSFKADAASEFPDAGWEIRDRNDAAPGIRRFVEQVAMFLTLVGLTALGVGGVGASEAVTAFLDRKRFDIAILKTLGADGRLVFLVFFLQVMAIALAAVLLGAVIGASSPYAIAYFYKDSLPMPPELGIYLAPLLLAAGFGLLSAVLFAVPPLGRAQAIPPASLLRENVAPSFTRPAPIYLIAASCAAFIIAALMLLRAPSPRFAAEFLGGAAAVLVVLRLVAEGLTRGFRKLPHPRSPLLRLALGDLTRPGAATGGVITALGLGLTLLATVTLLDRSITAEVHDALPARAPSFFFVDIQPDQVAAFDKTIAGFKSQSDFKRTPMIRGRITSLNGVPSAEAKIASDTKWIVNGDRGITYAATPPPGTTVTRGEWWPAGYSGPTLISLDQDAARGTGLKIGDSLTLNVLGREITGRIANFRKVDFTTGGQNFVLVLSPGVIDKAPHSFLATVRVDGGDENAMYNAVTGKFPNVSTVRVKDAIAQVDTLLQQLAAGIRAASLVTILAGLLVLAGTIAAGARTRLYDATVLKVVGATRAQIAMVYIAEYGVLGITTGVIALGAGSLAALIAARQILNISFVFDASAALITVLGGGAATLLFGLLGALTALQSRPAARLRNG